ncbi:hypothetical protein EVJ50_11430 [Synechococcus sp. RSCCF101]|uniref:hypothetical protein n=1 Tax=Synechococcus sp. RSCCF101 TaxID=2511069 RepID=UPI001247F636|nr:hypothetical protein [Synechococcus sp. RSCCF101]QEY32747.1 hypothetical protein EVJ50_11430 [Synechococcus sp. RSCCF101]
MSSDRTGRPSGTPGRSLPAGPSLPPGLNATRQSLASGQAVTVEGTNVIRVPFGVRRPRRERPARPERLATLVLPLVANGSAPTPPPAAA